ncbi:MAG: ATP-dependent Clp protease adapter ClpS [Pseudomonadota bacterium]
MSQTKKAQLVLNQVGGEFLSSEHQIQTAIKSKEVFQPPSKYQIVIMNDDFTPMDFVVEVLQKFFSMSIEKATEVMLAIHTQGYAVAGIYSKDIAETKVAIVNRYAREHEHPLLSRAERVES